MKVVLFCKSLRDSGGIERMTASLANELSKRSIPVYVVVCNADTFSFYPLELSVNVQSLNCNFLQRIKAAFRFRQMIKNKSRYCSQCCNTDGTNIFIIFFVLS